MKTEEEIINKVKSIVDNRFVFDVDKENQKYYDGWLDCMEWILGIKKEERSYESARVNTTI